MKCISCILSSFWILAVFMAVFFGERGSVHAQVDQAFAVDRVKPSFIYRPTAIPDRIVLTINGDPRTSIAVNWRTSTEVKSALAEIVAADARPYFSEKSTQVSATTQMLNTDINEAHFHTCVFADLQPATKYAYRVGDGNNWSEWFHFRTASADDEAFSFIYFGDAQNNVRSMWSRVIREAFTDSPKAAFLLHAGDLVNIPESDAEWGEWFGAGAWINAMIPNIAIPGNHEMHRDETGKRRLTHHWRPNFEFPLNGPEGLEETCYTVVYHNLRLIGLNSNEQLELQAEWLDNVLAENECEWVICFFHHPVFSTGADRDNPKLRALWKPIMDKYQVDLVLQGHDHTYGRTGLKVPSVENTAETDLVKAEKQPSAVAARDTPNDSSRDSLTNVPTGVQQIDEEAGTVYVVSVSGPKMYNNKKPPFMKRLAEDTQLYQVIHVDGSTLKFESRTAVGELYDAFELRKRSGQVNELVEIDPEVSEHLRPVKDEP